MTLFGLSPWSSKKAQRILQADPVKQVDSSASIAAFAPRKFSTKVLATISRRAVSRWSASTRPFTIGSIRRRIASGETDGAARAFSGSKSQSRLSRARSAVIDARVYSSSSLNWPGVNWPDPAPFQVRSPVRRSRSRIFSDKPLGAAASRAACRMHRLTASDFTVAMIPATRPDSSRSLFQC